MSMSFGENATARWLGRLRTVAAGSDVSARASALFLHPELFAEDVEQALREAIDTLPASDQVSLRHTLDEMVDLRDGLQMRRIDYVLSDGPIEGLWAAVSRKEMDIEHALRLASQTAADAVLAPVYVAAVRSLSNQLHRAGSDTEALMVLRLLLSALEARPGGVVRDQAGRDVALTYADRAGDILREEADGRLFRRAEAAAGLVAESARTSGDSLELADALMTLGSLRLDPWTWRRPIDLNFEKLVWRWEQRFFETHRAELVSVPEEEWRMPPVREAMAAASLSFREAADVRVGHDRGVSLRYQVLALMVLRTLGQEVDEAAIRSTATEAIALLDVSRLPQERLVLLNTIHVLGGTVDRGDIEAVVDVSLDELIRRHGVVGATDLLLQASSAMASVDERRALELGRDLRSLIAMDDHENGRQMLWLHQLELVEIIAQKDGRPITVASDLDDAVRDLRRRADDGAWDVLRLASGMVRLVRRSANVDAETRGLELLAELAQLAPAFASEYADALAYLRAELQIGLGSNAYLAGDADAAVGPYGDALAAYMTMKLPSKALDVVGRLRDCVGTGTPVTAALAALSVCGYALDLQAGLGEPATRVVQEVCKQAISRNSVGSVNPEALIFLLEAAKGQRFGAQFFSGVRYRPDQDEAGTDQLRRIAEAERAIDETSYGEELSAVDERTLLTAYIEPDNPRSGDSPADRLANLRHAYDAHLNRQLAGHRSDPIFLPMDVIRSSLDERTVLLVQYLGRTHDGNLAILTLALGKDIERTMVVDLGVPDEGDVRVELDGRIVAMSPVSGWVEALREELEPAPQSWSATPTALGLLESGREALFGDLLDDLETWRAAGKDHVCFVPHGPLHMYPYHLLPEGGQPLAATWRVSYLPNLYLLVADQRPGMRRRHPRPVAAFGLSYESENPFGLPRIPEARREAQRVAEHFGVEATVDADVTEQRVIEGLTEARYVHIAAHGRHDVDAPAFQCIYLTPDGESDGRLNAYELLAHDLRGTELVTLSACETALGRFDSADNLVGLPASLMLAGVETIVGTQWPVETNASEFFYSELYRALSEGIGRLDSFVRAQRATRARFPAYRDWGCFSYMGEWR
ncbi:CHAT domain-containing protein [Microbacteriaceae bacterium VKM Ac-2855]|nr:CHAT domain-containing protein [Microbacteriaceae bacterium VKM Ac-2855]